jgi:hypothetical protein
MKNITMPVAAAVFVGARDSSESLCGLVGRWAGHLAGDRKTLRIICSLAREFASDSKFWVGGWSGVGPSSGAASIWSDVGRARPLR